VTARAILHSMLVVDYITRLFVPESEWRDLPKVSSSSIAAELGCNAARVYQYSHGLIALRTPPHLALGSLIHEALAQLLVCGQSSVLACHAAIKLSIDKLSERTEYAATDWEALGAQALGALLYHVPRMNLPAWETLAVEFELGVVLTLEDGRRVLLTGRIDWIALHKPTGVIYLIDHKTSASEALGPLFVEHDAQLVIYRELLKAHGWDIGGTLHHQLSSSAPKQPKRNKDGQVAASKLRSDWETVCYAIQRAGGDPWGERYAKLREHCERQVFRRWAEDVTSEHAHATMFTEIRRTAARMTLPAQPPLTHNRRAWNCAKCFYRTWCDADLQGLDKSSLLGVHYHSDEPPGEWAQVSGSALQVETERSALLGKFAGGWTP
jgi:hypothetical protein